MVPVSKTAWSRRSAVDGRLALRSLPACAWHADRHLRVINRNIRVESVRVHSPRLAASSSYRRKPVSRKPDSIPCLARNDGPDQKTIPRGLPRGSSFRRRRGTQVRGVPQFFRCGATAYSARLRRIYPSFRCLVGRGRTADRPRVRCRLTALTGVGSFSRRCGLARSTGDSWFRLLPRSAG